jgi:circadian clock protein KaiB
MAPPAQPGPHYALALYVAGATEESLLAVDRVRSWIDEEMGGDVDLRVVDLHEHPELAAADDVVATPTLIRRLPEPVKRVVGRLLVERLASVIVMMPAPEPGEGT